MKRKRIQLGAVLSLIFILGGCASGQWQSNRENFKLLEAGMTKAEVLEIMGEPREIAAYKNSEWLVYQTERMIDESVDRESRRARAVNEWQTVLLIRDGKFAGTDRNYWENRYKYRIIR